MQMIAVVVFIYALLSFIKHNVETELIRIE
jgi:hypothetical protein